MNTVEQAYIEGFLKRASEHGVDNTQAMELLKHEAQNNPEKANVLLQSLLGGGLTGGGYNLYKDFKSSKDSPSRVMNIVGGGLLGTVGGGLGGAGLGYLAKQLGADVDPMMGMRIGALGGQVAGQGIGANRYNRKVDEFLKAQQDKQQ
jgi:hypothetical protein